MSKGTCIVWGMRHGNIEGNRWGDPGLSDDGKWEVEEVVEEVIELFGVCPASVMIVCSKSRRAVETAEIAGKKLRVGVTETELLNEGVLTDGGDSVVDQMFVLAGNAEMLIMVGHEPDIASWPFLMHPKGSGRSQSLRRGEAVVIHPDGITTTISPDDEEEYF